MRTALLAVVQVTPSHWSRGVDYAFMLQYEAHGGKVIMNGHLEPGAVVNVERGLDDTLKLNPNVVVFDTGVAPTVGVYAVHRANKIKALSSVLDIMEHNGSIRLGRLKELAGVTDEHIALFGRGDQRRVRQPEDDDLGKEEAAKQVALAVNEVMVRHRVHQLRFSYFNGRVNVVHASGQSCHTEDPVPETLLDGLKHLLQDPRFRPLAGGFNALITFAGDSVIQAECGDYIVPVYMSETV